MSTLLRKVTLARVMAKVRKSSFYCTGASLCLHAVILLLLSIFWISQETQETKAITVAVAEVFLVEEKIEFEFSSPEENLEQERSLALAEDMSEVSISDPAEAVIVEAAHVNAPPSMEVLLQEIETPVSIPAAEEGTPGQSGRHAAGYRSGDGGSGTGQGGYVSFFTASAKDVRSVVYLVDTSGSMRGKRREAVKEEVKRSIKALPETMLFNVIFFSSTIEEIDDKGLRVASRENKREATVWVHNFYGGGATLPKRPLKKALELKPDVIFFLTDGVFSDDVLDYVASLNRGEGGAPVCAIWTLGTEVNGEGNSLLQRIALQNGGIFRIVH